MKAVAAAAVLAMAACSTAGAGPLALPPPPQAGFTQNIGAALPLRARFLDDDGTPVTLQQLLEGHGTLLLFGYYRCRMLCSVVGAGVLEALAHAQPGNDAVRIVEIGIDPGETPADAAEKKDEYARRFGALAGRVHLLTGDAHAIDAVATAGGFGYSYDAAQRQYVHPAGFLVVTPQGRISRYFLGVRFDPHELGDAIVQADDGRTGSVLERLLCAHYDPSSGRNSATIMAIVRSACVALCVVLPAWVWRRRTRRNDK